MDRTKMYKIAFLMLSVLYVLFIFSNSLKNGDASSDDSTLALKLIQGVFDSIGLGINVTEHFVRKLAHFAEYFLLGTFLLTDARILNLEIKKSFLFALPIGLGVAIVDEIIQGFTPERNPSALDVLLDFSAVVCASVLVTVVIKVFLKLKQRKPSDE